MLVIFVVALASCGGLAAVCIAGQESTRSEAGLKGAIPAAWSRATKGLPAGPGAIRFQPLGLSMLRPYVAGKVPVVFVHGLWGSPDNWAGLIDALEADPFLSERYQFLTFGYAGRKLDHLFGARTPPRTSITARSTRSRARGPGVGSHDPDWPQHGRTALQDDGSGQRLDSSGI